MIDVLIIGSGIAGLTAALNASESSSNVVVLSKAYPTHSQSVQAQGGINAVLYEENDSVDIHIEDTYIGGCNLANKEHIKFMCENAKDTIYWLDSIGVPFNRTNDNKIAQRKFGGTKKIRTCYSSDYSGLKILHTLYDRCIKKNIQFVNENMLLNLIIENGKCFGAISLDIQNGQVNQYLSKTVILATGGYAGIYYNHTTNSYSNTADGIAIAFNAGVKLSNMEFVQFHPTSLEKSNVLISESARGEGGYLLDANMNRFIDELKPRDEVSRAIYEKIQKNEKVYLDLRHLGIEKIKECLPQERSLALNYSNVKIEDEILAITPAAHYSMGGINTDINTKTNIENLFACGECADISVHGANRLGGNSLLEIVTFGKVAGINAANKAKEIKENTNISSFIKNEMAKIETIFQLENRINFYEEKIKIGDLLFNNLGLFRTYENMQNLLDELNNTRKNFIYMGIDDKSKVYNKNLVELLEFRNMIDVAILVCEAAISREESRGSHFRLDFPNQRDEYQKSSILINKGDFIESKYEDKL